MAAHLRSKPSPESLLKEGELHLRKGEIGLARVFVRRAALLLDEKGIPPESNSRLTKLFQGILLAKTLHEELEKNPQETQKFLNACAEKLQQKLSALQAKTLSQLT